MRGLWPNLYQLRQDARHQGQVPVLRQEGPSRMYRLIVAYCLRIDIRWTERLIIGLFRAILPWFYLNAPLQPCNHAAGGGS